MFLAFFPPFITRYSAHPDYLWILLKQASAFNPRQVAFMVDAAYLKDYKLGNRSYHINGVFFKSPSRRALSRFKTYPLALESCADLRQLPMLETFQRLLTEVHPGLVKELEKRIRQAQNERRIQALLSWIYVPSLSAAAQICGLPVIYNELGPLRPPNYRPAIYFDFQGVNGHTSAEKEARIFYREFSSQAKITLLTLEEIRNLLLARPVPQASHAPAYSVGVPLQRADDSNVIAFNRGLSFNGLIQRAQQDFPEGQILARHHPSGDEFSMPPAVNKDLSNTAYEFLIQCERVYTLNSSVAFDCLLFGKPVRIFGDSPAAFLSMEKAGCLPKEVYLSHLNYLFLCYLVPAEFLFCEEYYTWRLTHPPLDKIFYKHLAYWQNTPRTLLTQKRHPPPLFHLLKQAPFFWRFFKEGKASPLFPNTPAASQRDTEPT